MQSSLPAGKPRQQTLPVNGNTRLPHPRWSYCSSAGGGRKALPMLLVSSDIYTIYRVLFFDSIPSTPYIRVYSVGISMEKRGNVVTPETHIRISLPMLPVFPLLFPYHLVFQAFSDRGWQLLFCLGAYSPRKTLADKTSQPGRIITFQKFPIQMADVELRIIQREGDHIGGNRA